MIPTLITAASSLLDKWIPDADERARLAHELATMAERHGHEIAQAQIAVNQAEAGHRSIWVAGWRPAVGWVCVLALGWHFVLSPIGATLAGLAGYTWPDIDFDMGTLLTVLMGMLGLGGLRTYEKAKGLTK